MRASSPGGAEGDARAAGAAARSARVAALFADDAHIDLRELAAARSLDGAGGGRAALNSRFAFATVQGTCQSNRRGQVAAMWAARDAERAGGAGGAGQSDAPRDAVLTDDAWEARRREAAARERARLHEQDAGACERRAFRV
jgi:hypothetical protein